MLRIFIGQDDVENVAYHTLCNSIMRQASVPVSITPIKLSHLKGIYGRDKDERQSNEFSFTRFLVPYLCDYSGPALFMDCDMLVRCDIKELFDLFDDRFAVQCVQHDYTPKSKVKFLGNIQYEYPRKNWSSVMLFNCGKCRDLTPDYIDNATPAELHRMYWAGGDEMIGELDPKWNHLVDEYEHNNEAKIVHYTIGGPYFQEYWNCDYCDEWYAENRKVNWCQQL